MKTLWQTFLLVVGIFAVALIAEQIAPLQQFSLYLARHPRPYNTIAIGLAVAGWVLLGIAFVLLFLKKSRPVSAEEARSFVKPVGLVQSLAAWGMFGYFFVIGPPLVKNWPARERCFMPPSALPGASGRHRPLKQG